jgi:hypothetical protein
MFLRNLVSRALMEALSQQGAKIQPWVVPLGTCLGGDPSGPNKAVG